MKSDNLLLGFEDHSVIKDYAAEQAVNEPLHKSVDGRTTYDSRPDFGPIRGGIRSVQISDFGAAVFGDANTLHRHDI